MSPADDGARRHGGIMKAATSAGWLSRPGVVCALGESLADVARGLYAGDTSGMQASDAWIHGRTTVVGSCAGSLPAWPEGLAAHQRSRNNQLLLAAAQQIEPALRQAIARHGAHRVGVVLGTSTSSINDNAGAFIALRDTGRWPDSYDYRRQALSAPSVFLAQWLGSAGPAQTVSTACTSSARALMTAHAWLRMGICDAVVCGGADSLCRFTLQGFTSLGAISDTLCNPFSAARKGISIGEAAALFLMEREPADGGSVALLGSGASSDAWHMSSPEPSGRGARQAMQTALREAGMQAADIGWVNLHGTGTELNDAMESLAMQALFPDRGVPCASTKALTGHALGAAGALEAVLAWITLTPEYAARPLPAHVWDGQADPTLPALDFSGAGQRYAPGKRRVAMSNSFAFGGNNTSLILGAAS
ncbi:MAG: beta-ketoacyl-ACP synthase [Bordetella sp.]|uniref:beta-ketoacyl-ACP synthase n=1 Tax=Bordetella sp. TaxID=28081 RepID=UPI003F7CAD53